MQGREKTSDPSGQLSKSTKVSDTEEPVGHGGEGPSLAPAPALWLAMCLRKMAISEVDVWQAELKSGTCVTERKANS